ncbi:hypothetical protein GCM10010365_08990 [Streptomyces poonensis]|uniref:Uncharacterized protein n=1 Tax=Streptomyces poonensis TaxID=68255 RepID=A0A918P9H4_9ACTN|nr:hypothetical protein GCM10010365_08990 [Streptomyces poonensis]GLJ87662.1 hypothetical protein GCM10017589_02620 [Streptomyces poonensis]
MVVAGGLGVGEAHPGLLEGEQRRCGGFAATDHEGKDGAGGGHGGASGVWGRGYSGLGDDRGETGAEEYGQGHGYGQ